MSFGHGTWSYAGVSLAQLGIVEVKRIPEGALSVPGRRGQNLKKASIVGEQFGRKPHDARRVAMILVLDPGQPVTDPNLAMYSQLDALNLLFAEDRREQALVHHHPDGIDRTGMAEVLDGHLSPIPDPQAALLNYLIDFNMSDPWFYRPSVVVTQAISASPQAFTLTNPGNIYGNKLLIDFVGPIANPRLTNLTNGDWVELDVTVASGQHALIDCTLFIATNNAVNAIQSLQHSGDFAFMVIEPGVNNLQVTSTSPGGSVTLTFQPPFV